MAAVGTSTYEVSEYYLDKQADNLRPSLVGR